MEKKRYIGTTDDGEQVFCEWEFKAGVLKSSVTYYNKSGADISMCRNFYDQLLKNFPDDGFVEEFCAVCKEWSGNDLSPGTPRQMDAVNRTIKHEYERLEEERKSMSGEFWRQIRLLRKRLNMEIHPTRVDKVAINIITYLKETTIDETKSPMSPIVIPQYVANKVWGSGRWTLRREAAAMLRRGAVIKHGQLSCKYDTPTDYYSYTVSRLKDLGLYRDPDYMVDGKAYVYGSQWLTCEIPADIVEKILKWEPKPEAPKTRIQKYCEKFHITPVRKGRTEHADVFDVTVTTPQGSEVFEYTLGYAHNGEISKKDFASCLLRDARFGCMGFHDAVLELEEMGYESVSEVVRIAEACLETYDKLCGLGLWDEELAEEA